MTDADYSRFVTVLTRLAEQTRASITADTIDAHFEVLSDCEFCDIEAAARVLGRGEWFPKAGAWRDHARTIASSRLREERRDQLESREPKCSQCEDQGWICQMCERIDCVPGAPHERRMMPCRCRSRNKG